MWILLLCVTAALFQCTLCGSTFEYFDYYDPSVPFVCVNDHNCILNCYGSLACWTAVIYGPTNAELTVNCDSSRDVDHNILEYGDSRGCNELTIHAQHSTKLTINVYNQPNELSESNIYTPTASLSTIGTFITCGITTNSTYPEPVLSVCGNNNNIYSRYGWQTVQWTLLATDDGNNGTFSNDITMHCGQDYLTSCTTHPQYIVVDDKYVCDLQQCDVFTTLSPTRPSPTAPSPAATLEPTPSTTSSTTPLTAAGNALFSNSNEYTATIIIVVGIIVLFGGAVVAGYWYGKKEKSKQKAEEQTRMKNEIEMIRQKDEATINAIINVVGCNRKDAMEAYQSKNKNEEAAIHYLLDNKENINNALDQINTAHIYGNSGEYEEVIGGQLQPNVIDEDKDVIDTINETEVNALGEMEINGKSNTHILGHGDVMNDGLNEEDVDENDDNLVNELNEDAVTANTGKESHAEYKFVFSM